MMFGHTFIFLVGCEVEVPFCTETVKFVDLGGKCAENLEIFRGKKSIDQKSEIKHPCQTKSSAFDASRWDESAGSFNFSQKLFFRELCPIGHQKMDPIGHGRGSIYKGERSGKLGWLGYKHVEKWPKTRKTPKKLIWGMIRAHIPPTCRDFFFRSDPVSYTHLTLPTKA